MRPWVIVICAFFFGLADSGAENGTKVKWASPDRKYAIKTGSVEEGIRLEVQLVEPATGRILDSCEVVAKHIKCAWSPDSQWLAITGILSPEITDVILFRTASGSLSVVKMPADILNDEGHLDTCKLLPEADREKITFVWRRTLSSPQWRDDGALAVKAGGVGIWKEGAGENLQIDFSYGLILRCQEDGTSTLLNKEQLSCVKRTIN